MARYIGVLWTFESNPKIYKIMAQMLQQTTRGGCLIIILTNLHVRQNPSIKQINWQLPITVLSCQKPRVFLPKYIVNFAAGFSNRKELKRGKTDFQWLFYNAWIHFRRMNCISRNVRWFSAEQKWGTWKTKKFKVYMSKLIFHFSVNPFRGVFAGRKKKGLTKKVKKYVWTNYTMEMLYSKILLIQNHRELLTKDV